MTERDRGLSALGYAAVIAAASYRLWALMALDTITKPLRRKIFSEISDEQTEYERKAYEWLKLWMKCPWCAGAWVTAAVTFVFRKRVPSPLLVGMAAAAGTALLGGNDDRMMESDEDLGYG